jgi:predicted Zn-dependent peptidase
VLVPKAELGQTLIVVGRPAIRARSEDVAPLELASTVFGGFFGSRLNMNLREAKGYSYGATAYLDARRGQGPLVASSAVRADVTGPALKEVLNELDGLKQRPISSKELEPAREGLIRSLPGSFTTVEDLLQTSAGLYWEEKPLDYYAKLVDELTAATPAQVQAAAEKYFDPKTLSVVMVGDPKTVQSQVGPLNLGELKVHPPPRPPTPASMQAPVPGVAGPGAVR